MLTTVLCLVLAVDNCLAALHPSTPCPNVFSYEGSQPEHERWIGSVLLSTDESLVGVRLDIKLDRPAEILVSWTGKVTTDDNKLFTILNLDQRLHPGPPIASRFMVKFNSIKGSPQVQTIRLNGKQICPPDSYVPTDSHHNNQDHINENRYTTERVTRRPDLDIDEDWTNSRPVPPVRNPGSGSSYNTPVRETQTGYSSSSGHSSGGGYNRPSSQGSSSNVGYSSGGSNPSQSGDSGYGHSQIPATPGFGSSSGNVYQNGGSSLGLSNSGGSGYSQSGHPDILGYNNQGTGSNSYSGQGGSNYNSNQNKNTRTTTEGYDSHETYHANHRPSSSSSGSGYSNSSREGTNQDNFRPLATDYNGPSRPSISININKDVTYNVDRPDTINNNDPNIFSSNRPGERDPPFSNSHNSKTTERYDEHNNDYHTKPTTKKPVVINSININIHSSDIDNPPSDGMIYSTSSKTTTKRPSTNNNKNTNNNRATTRKPSTTTSRTSSNNGGYQSSRPSRNPEISSASHHQTGYNQNNYNEYERSTEKNYNGHSNQGQNNQRPPGVDFIDTSRPNPIPSSKPNEGTGNKKIPRPPDTSGNTDDISVKNRNVKCGTVEVNPAPLITHGQNTARGQWPWHIALYRIEGINLSYSCGGSLISPTVVLTAAHCVTKAPRDRPVDADILVVQLGKYHLYQFSDDSVQNKQVQTLYVHPRYNSTNYLDDLAILILSSPAEFTKFVRPVCLWPKHNFNLPNIDNKEGTVVGWGYDENNQVTEELKMARMPVVSYVTCIKSYPQFFSQFTAENKTYCAGFRQGTSVCNGDSGGGMVFQHNNVWYLRGLVSITVAKQGLRVCDTKHYVVFTDVANYFDWVSQYI